MELRAAGYGAIWRGQRSWNGVAILAKGQQPEEVRRALPGDAADDQSRYLEALVGGITVACLYLPNGNPQPGPKFTYKLAWFERLIEHAQALYASGKPVVLAGDFNVVPTDFDIYNSRSWLKDALLQPASRACYQRLLAQGWGRLPAGAPPRPAHLHVLGLLPEPLAKQFRSAHRSPALECRARATPCWRRCGHLGARARESE